MSEASIALIRSGLAFACLLILTRLLGKTQISQLTFFEYITGISIGSIASELSINLSIRTWPIFVGLLTWVGLALLTQIVTLKSPFWARLVDGQASVVVQDGQILEGQLRSLRMRAEDLTSLLRQKGVFAVQDVETALMEPRGELSVLFRPQKRPATPGDMKLSVGPEGLGMELIIDGKVQEQNLRRVRLNRAWLGDRLREQNVQSPEEVFLGVVDPQGRLYVDRYEDRIPPKGLPGDHPGPH